MHDVALILTEPNAWIDLFTFGFIGAGWLLHFLVTGDLTEPSGKGKEGDHDRDRA